MMPTSGSRSARAVSSLRVGWLLWLREAFNLDILLKALLSGGQFNAERAPGAFAALHGDLATHQVDVALDDRQPQAGVQALGLARRIGPVEALEDVRPGLRLDADPGVAHLDVKRAV